MSKDSDAYTHAAAHIEKLKKQWKKQQQEEKQAAEALGGEYQPQRERRFKVVCPIVVPNIAIHPRF